MGISKFNAGATVDWGIDTKAMPFKKTSQVELGKEYNLRGFFITPDNGYGKGAVLISDDFLLNAPTRLVETITEMLNDTEVVDAVKAGQCAFKVYTFESKQFKRTGYGVEFIDK